MPSVEAIPLLGTVTDTIVKLSPSVSISFASTSIWLLVESSITVMVSSFAVGGSFTPPTVI